MIKLQEKEIDKLIDKLSSISQHILDITDSWQSFTELKVLYSVKAMLLAVWKLCNDYQVDINLSSLPSIKLSYNVDDDYDEIVEIQYELESAMESFIYPSEDIMLKYGWKEIILVSEDELPYKYDSEFIDKEVKKYFGDAANILPNAICFMNDVICAGFEAYDARIMTNTKVGMFLDFAENNSSVKQTKLYKQIKHCTYEIISPFIWHYPYDCHGVKDGCLYAFTTGGGFDYGDEFITNIHGKVYRCIYVQLLDQLLDNAEKQYGYSKISSKKSAKAS